MLRVNLSIEDYEKFRQLAKAECRSVPGHARFLIRKDIEEREKSWSQ